MQMQMQMQMRTVRTAGSGFRRLSQRTLAPSARVVRAAASMNDLYLCLGVSHCFEKNSEGKLQDCFQIEPISASSLECMATGARTSFKCATGMKFGEAITKDKDNFPLDFAEARFCDKFQERCEAAARTWARAYAQDNLMDIVPLGKVKSNFNFSLDDKRVLNFDNVVNDDDNVKQDMSIDVYGRKEKEEKEAEEAAKKAKREEEDLEALLGA